MKDELNIELNTSSDFIAVCEAFQEGKEEAVEQAEDDEYTSHYSTKLDQKAREISLIFCYFHGHRSEIVDHLNHPNTVLRLLGVVIE
jgi:hypothetical protein